MRLEQFLEACDGTMKRDGTGNGKDGEKKRKRKRKGTVDNAPDNGMAEALKMPKPKQLKNRIKKLIFDDKVNNVMDKIEDFIPDVSHIIKELGKISGQPEFGKKSVIGDLIFHLKKLESKASDVADVYNTIYEKFGKNFDKTFAELE